MSALKILYVTSHWPGAAPYGAQQRVQQIGRLLKQCGDVSVVVVTDDDRWRKQSEAEFDIVRVVPVRPSSAGGIVGRLRHELDPGYLQTVPLGVDASEREAVLDLVAGHDLAWVHTIKTADLLRIDRWPHAILDIDDIPSGLYASSARADGAVGRRLLDWRMSVIWRRRERRLAERFSVLLVCSEIDRQYLGIEQVRVLPNGFERLARVSRSPAQPPRLGFIGNFQWYPNVEGVRWFCGNVWPLVRRELPQVELRVVGEGTEVASGWGRDISGLGRMRNVGDEIASWSGMIVPIRTGAGTRIKVVEAFARCCPLVATSLGAYGYDLRDEEELFLADTPDVFARRCLELIRDPQRAEAMAERAHRRFLMCWTWESYAEIVRAAVHDVCRKGSGVRDT